MKKIVNKVKPKSEFSRNVLTLMTGTTIAQAIPIAISPILTRIYTPEDFGVLALFIAITSIFGSIANGRYELAIMLPENDEDAINIFALGFIITCCLSIVLFVAVILFKDYFVMLLDNREIELWLYFVPIAVFFIGSFNILNYFNTRLKNYKDIKNATIIKSIVLAIIQLGIGFIKQGASGLISGQILSNIFANVRLLKNIIKDKVLINEISQKKMIAVAKRYKKFPQFSMWAIFANMLSVHFTNVLISAFYSIGTLGYYSFVQKMLGMPSVLIGNSIGQVFFQEATKERHRTGKAITTFNSTVKKLTMIGVPFFFVLFFIVEDVFAIIFGEDWRIAGTYAKILIPLYCIRFIVASISVTNSVFEKQDISLYWQIGLLVSSILIILFSYGFNFQFKEFLLLFSSVISLVYLILFFILYFVSRRKL